MTPVIRPYRQTDFNPLLSLIDAIAAPRRIITPTSLHEFLTDPGYQPAIDLVVAPGTGERQVDGARDVRLRSRGDEDCLVLESWGGVHPDADFGRVAPPLLAASLRRASQILAERNRPIGIFQARCAAADTRTNALYEDFGLTEARLLMPKRRPGLDQLPTPRIPPGIVIHSYCPGDGVAWVAAFNDAFADHWGGFMAMTPERWEHQRRSETFDPRLSLVAWDGEQIAGFCHGVVDARLNALNGQQSAMIRYVGVRPAWRQLGLGTALTVAALRALRDQGIEVVVLEVDAASPTGADRLYGRPRVRDR